MRNWLKRQMPWIDQDALARLNVAVHRDIGYTCASLILAYCLSGIAVNHIGDWNPDFVITKQTVSLPQPFAKEDITQERIAEFGRIVNEDRSLLSKIAETGWLPT